jgi:hypothetical protein
MNEPDSNPEIYDAYPPPPSNSSAIVDKEAVVATAPPDQFTASQGLPHNTPPVEQLTDSKTVEATSTSTAPPETTAESKETELSPKDHEIITKACESAAAGRQWEVEQLLNEAKKQGPSNLTDQLEQIFVQAITNARLEALTQTLRMVDDHITQIYNDVIAHLNEADTQRGTQVDNLAGIVREVGAQVTNLGENQGKVNSIIEETNRKLDALNSSVNSIKYK